ncbi:unnamed protein product [Rhizoctonia solani]|uniref:Uncharacterized protein n=1 Tax=Rhizoctonia solani TaxID=456999 RepID=A0A8H3BJB6_9AGAM|nr:unnamed protein product [Rhizoctonia solani]
MTPKPNESLNSMRSKPQLEKLGGDTSKTKSNRGNERSTDQNAGPSLYAGKAAGQDKDASFTPILEREPFTLLWEIAKKGVERNAD